MRSIRWVIYILFICESNNSFVHLFFPSNRNYSWYYNKHQDQWNQEAAWHGLWVRKIKGIHLYISSTSYTVQWDNHLNNEPVNQISNQPNNKLVNLPSHHPVSQLNNQPVNHLPSQPANQSNLPASQSTNQPATQLASQSIIQPTNQPTSQPISYSIYQPTK